MANPESNNIFFELIFPMTGMFPCSSIWLVRSSAIFVWLLLQLLNSIPNNNTELNSRIVLYCMKFYLPSLFVFFSSCFFVLFYNLIFYFFSTFFLLFRLFPKFLLRYVNNIFYKIKTFYSYLFFCLFY